MCSYCPWRWRARTAPIAWLSSQLWRPRWVALYGFFVLLGIGYGGAALIPGTTVVARWFTTQRATALSVAATGNSFGAVVLVPPVALLVGALGLDGAARWMALALLVGTLPVTWLVLR